jgi:hypothetical protein
LVVGFDVCLAKHPHSQMEFTIIRRPAFPANRKVLVQADRTTSGMTASGGIVRARSIKVDNMVPACCETHSAGASRTRSFTSASRSRARSATRQREENE